MKKKLASFLCCLFLLFSIVPFVYASDKSNEVVNDQFDQKVETLKQQSGILDGFLIGQAQNLFHIGGINSINNLIFGNPYGVWFDSDTPPQMENGLYSQQELDKVILPMIHVFSGAYVVTVILAIMMAALRMSLKAYSPQSRSDFWDNLNMWVLSAFFMGLFGTITSILFDVNQGIVDSMSKVIQSFGVDVKSLSIIASAGDISVGDIFVFLAEWGLALYLNIIYIARKIVILLLMALAPVAAISLCFPRTRSFFGSWLKEYAGNIFLQSIHALVMCLFAGLSSVGGAGMIYKLGMLIMFVPVSGMVSRWLQLGDSSSALGHTTTMMGLSSVAGAIALARGVGGVAKGARGSGSGTGAGSPSATNRLGTYEDGNDRNPTSITEAAKGTGSVGWQRVKNMAGKAGGLAGATIGLGFGAGGSAIGALVGSKAGQAIAQASRNLSSGSFQAMKLHKDNRALYGNREKGWWKGNRTAYANMWNDLSARRQFMGNMGEAVGSALGLGEAGRGIGQMMSGVSQRRLQQEALGNRTLEDYARENPGANVQWRQNNQGSAFFMQDAQSGAWRQISAMGSADPTLRKGEERRVDYKLNDGSNWNRQENGGYVASPSSPYTSGATRVPILGSKGQIPSSATTATPSFKAGSAPISVNPVGSPPVSSRPSLSNSSLPLGQTSALGGTHAVSGGTSLSSGNMGTSNSSNLGSIASSPRQVVGLSGSTPHLGRSSGTYIQGADGRKYQDSRVDVKKINPDQYFSHNVAGASRQTVADKGADMIHRSSTKGKEVTKTIGDKCNKTSKMAWGQAAKVLDKVRNSGVV